MKLSAESIIRNVLELEKLNILLEVKQLVLKLTEANNNAYKQITKKGILKTSIQTVSLTPNNPVVWTFCFSFNNSPVESFFEIIELNMIIVNST